MDWSDEAKARLEEEEKRLRLKAANLQERHGAWSLMAKQELVVANDISAALEEIEQRGERLAQWEREEVTRAANCCGQEERAEAAEADRDEWRETAQSEMAGRRAAEAAHKEAAAQWQDEARLRRAAEAEAKRLRLDLTEACRGGAVLARERNEAEALTQRFAKLLERCEDVVLGYDQLHGGGGTSPLAQEICAALRGGGK